VASIGCFAAALLLPYAAAQSLIPAATAALLAKAALSMTYILSGLPQLAETVYAAVAGKIDTHVLMSLSVLGTLYMGLAQEVSQRRHSMCFSLTALPHPVRVTWVVSHMAVGGSSNHCA
jgi:hypothetical protein